MAIGLDDEVDPAAIFSRVVDAAFVGPDHIAVLDQVPPYLRLFDRSGQLVETYLPEGSGPGEARRPYAVAGNPRGDIVVLHDGRVSLLSLGRGFIASVRPTGFVPQDIGRGCDGWVIYGPSHRWTEAGERTWARVATIDSAAVTVHRETLPDSSEPRILPFKPGQAAGGEGGWVIHDVFTARHLRPVCQDSAEHTVPSSVLRDVHALLERQPGAGEGMTIRAGDASHTGFAVMGSDVLLSVGVFNPRGAFDSLLILFTPDERRVGSSAMRLRLADVSSRGELLLTFGAPVPHVRALPSAAAERLLPALH